MPGGLELDRERQPTAPDARQQFLARLNRTLGPAMLLRLEAIHVHRQLRRSYHIGEINEFPPRQLSPIAQIEVFAQGIILPASALLDAGTPPQPGRPIKIEKSAAAAARDLLKQKMPIQENRLHACEQRIPPVQMPPARLDHSDLRIGEEMDGALEQVLLRNKIGVQDAKKFTFRSSEPDRQCASLKAGAVSPMNALYVKTALAQFPRARGGDVAGLVRRIVQDLDLQKFLRVIEFAHGTEQPLGHVHFVEDRQLHRHFRQLLEVERRHRWPLPVFQVQIDNEIAMNPISREPDEDAQVANRPDDMSDAFLHGELLWLQMDDAVRAT